MITKPARKSHNAITRIDNSLIRGESGGIITSFVSKVVGVTCMYSGVFVGVLVAEATGNIKVISGKGIRVVVGVTDGVALSVAVADGICDPTCTKVPVPIVTVAVNRYSTDARAELLITNNKLTRSMLNNTEYFFIVDFHSIEQINFTKLIE